MNEHKILSQLQGVKFSLSEEVQTKIISESQNDRRWLKANYNLEYPNPEIKPVQKEKLWQESTINQLYGLMPKFNTPSTYNTFIDTQFFDGKTGGQTKIELSYCGAQRHPK